MKNAGLAFIFITIFSSVLYSQQVDNNSYLNTYLQKILDGKTFNYQPSLGVVPDSETACAIAEIILSKIYGKEQIEDEKPFKAILIKDYWIIQGTLPQGYKGGVAEIVISKSNGQVISISHGK